MRKILVLLVVGTTFALAQPFVPDMDLFAKRRQAFMEKMQPGSVAVFPSGPELTRNLDVQYEYRQESNFYYLSGYEEPESIMLLVPSRPKYKFVLFVRKRDPRRETFEGPRSGIEGAMSKFRADTAFYVSDFESAIYRYIRGDGSLYYPFGVNKATDADIERLVVWRRSGGVWPIMDPTPILAGMRLIKNEGDFLGGLQKAVDISAKAHNEAIKSVRPGMYENEIQAVFEYTFRKNGSPRNGYPCIVGSGPNSTILHYSKNDRKMQDGEVLLMDCAAEYGYYSADITRTVPVNGKFSKEQRAIYQIVLDAQNAAMKRVRPGLVFTELDTTINDVLSTNLLRLGFIKEKKDFRIFTPHGYSHWIGLEVHDVGGYSRDGKPIVLAPGMVFTIEPGIYVRPVLFDELKERGYTEEDLRRIRDIVAPYMNIGVRIEDDVLVTDTGAKNLSEAAPREIDTIEKLMKR